MKRAFIYLFAISILATLGSCDDEIDIYNSSMMELDGNWYVKYNHTTLGTDPFEAGYTPLYLYNTAADNGQEIWLEDDGNFWEYKVRIPASPESLSFGSPTELTSIVEGYEIEVIIEKGKIIRDAVELPSGVMADSIYFEVWFEDLEGATGIANDRLLVGGFRKTGFPEDDPH